MVVDAEIGIRAYGLTKRGEFLSPYLEAKKSLPPLLAKVQVMVGENKLETQQFEDIKKSTEQQINFLQNTLNKLESSAIRVQSPEIIQVFAQSKLKMDNLRAKINAFADAGETYQKAVDRQIRELIDFTNFLLYAGFFFNCLDAGPSWYLIDILEKELRKRDACLE